jgi:hypothetical protein
MGLKESIKKDIDVMAIDDLFIISEQIKLLKKKKPARSKAYSLKEIHSMTATSKSNWSEDVVREREERGLR